MDAIGEALEGGRQHLLMEGGGAMTVYEAISLMITFGMFVIALLSFHKRK